MHHGFSVIFFILEKFRHIFYIYRNHVVWQNIFCHIKPEFRHLCKDSAFFGNLVVQNYVKAADAVSCNHDQAVAVIVDLAYLTFFDRF